MTVDRTRLDALITFALEHASDPLRGDDLVAAKRALLAEVLGPAADVDVVGPMTPAGAPNGLVLERDRVVAEYGDTTRVDEIASATKSLLALVCGVAVDDGLVDDLDAPVARTIDLAEFSGPKNGAITWRHLVQQTSEWDGELFGKVPTGHRGQRVGELLGPPGSFWEYNDVRVNLLARALLEVFGRPLPEVFAARIAGPVGLSDTWSWHGYSTSWVTVRGQQVESVSGGSHWGGGVWMHTRDLARLGRLVACGGSWDGEPVLSQQWIEVLATPCPHNPMYGAMWWLQYDRDRRLVSIAAQGGGSHQLFVVPDRDVVAVARWIRDDAWPGYLDDLLALDDTLPALGPVVYRFDEVNAATRPGG